MYRTFVKVRNNDDKFVWLVFRLLLSWFVLFMISFIIFIKSDGYIFAFLFMVAVIFLIIPIIVYLLRKRANVFNDCWSTKEVVFDVVDGILYTGDIKLNVGKYSSDDKIYVDNIKYVNESCQRGILVSSFIGVIEEEYSQSFCDFLLKSGVKICSLDDEYM